MERKDGQSAVPSGRRTLVRATGMVMVVIVALLAAQAVEVGYSFLAAPPDRAAGREVPRVSGMGRVWVLLAERHEAVAGLLYLVGMFALLARNLAAVRTRGFLYVESPHASKRGFGGFALDASVVAVQAGLIWMMSAALSGAEAGRAPLLAAALLLLDGFWLGWIYLWTRQEEAAALRSLAWSALLSVALGCALVAAAAGPGPWGGQPVHSPLLRSNAAALVGAALLVLGAAELYARGRVGGERARVGATRLVATLILALALAVGAVYVFTAGGGSGAKAPGSSQGSSPSQEAP